MRRLSASLTVTVSLLLAACGHSPETHLLTLDAVPPVSPGAAYLGPPVRFTAVEIPPAIDRLEFVRAVSPTELKIEDQYHWSASLGSLARAALLRDLAARLPAGAVLAPDSPALKGARRVDVAILALRTDVRRSTMDAIITISTDGGAQTMRRPIAVSRDHGQGQSPDQAAQDISALLGDVADAIALGLGQMPADPALPARTPAAQPRP